MSIITFEIIVIFLLTLCNGVLSMSEIAVVSARKPRLQQWADAGNRNARRILGILREPEEFLSTVQIGITLIGVLTGAFGGATIAQHLTVIVAGNESLAPYAESIAVGLVVIAITYLSLILGELVPKRIALNNPERIALLVAGPMRFLSRSTAPVVWLLRNSTKAVLWLFRVRPPAEPAITEDEIRIMLRQGADIGTIRQDERSMIERVFQLDTLRVSSMMTPRKDLVVLYTSDSMQRVGAKIARSGHSLFPLCEDTLEHVIGVVRAQDILVQTASGGPLDLRKIVRQPLFLPETILGLNMLKEFKRTENDTALLMDEFGGLQGIITATDILRAVVGDVFYTQVPRAVRRLDGSWLIDGLLAFEEMVETLRLKVPADEADRSFSTAGGCIMALLGRVPVEGDQISWSRYRFEVLDMDGLRVDKILASPLPGQEAEPR